MRCLLVLSMSYILVLSATRSSATTPACVSNNHLSGETSPSKVLSIDAINGILDEHNQARQDVNPLAKVMPMLKWNQKLADHAQTWIDDCPFPGGGLKHSSSTSRRNVAGYGYVGENLACGYGGTRYNVDNGGVTSTKAWNAEVADWKYAPIGQDKACRNGGTSCAVGHYTQDIWAKTLEVGCGYKYCADLTYKNYWVCLYGPGGNYRGQKPYEEAGNGTAAAKICAPTTAAPPTPAPPVTTEAASPPPDGSPTTAPTPAPPVVSGFTATLVNPSAATAPKTKADMAKDLASKFTKELGKTVAASDINVTEFNTTTGDVHFTFIGSAAGLMSEAEKVPQASLGLTGFAPVTAAPSPTNPPAAAPSEEDSSNGGAIAAGIIVPLLLIIGGAVAAAVFMKSKSPGGSPRSKGGDFTEEHSMNEQPMMGPAGGNTNSTTISGQVESSLPLTEMQPARNKSSGPLPTNQTRGGQYHPPSSEESPQLEIADDEI